MFAVAAKVFVLPLAVRKSLCLTACHRETKASFPLPLTGPYQLECATLSNHLAANRNYEHPYPPAGQPAGRPTAPARWRRRLYLVLLLLRAVHPQHASR